MTFDLTEEQRQVTLLALAELALSRPGWDMMLSELAVAFGGMDASKLYAKFKRLNADRVRESHLDAHGRRYGP